MNLRSARFLLMAFMFLGFSLRSPAAELCENVFPEPRQATSLEEFLKLDSNKGAINERYAALPEIFQWILKRKINGLKPGVLNDSAGEELVLNDLSLFFQRIEHVSNGRIRFAFPTDQISFNDWMERRLLVGGMKGWITKEAQDSLDDSALAKVRINLARFMIHPWVQRLPITNYLPAIADRPLAADQISRIVVDGLPQDETPLLNAWKGQKTRDVYHSVRSLSRVVSQAMMVYYAICLFQELERDGLKVTTHNYLLKMDNLGHRMNLMIGAPLIPDLTK